MNAQNINEILEVLAARFGSTGAHLWAVIVNAQRIDVVVWVLSLSILGLCVVIVWRRVGAWLRARTRDEDDVFWANSLRWAVAVVYVLIVTTTLPIQKLVNPEYAALKNILRMLGAGGQP